MYPDTAAPGREKIRQQLRLAKDVWDGLVSDLSEAQHQAETSAAQVNFLVITNVQFRTKIITDRIRNMGGGNVFTGVFLST